MIYEIREHGIWYVGAFDADGQWFRGDEDAFARLPKRTLNNGPITDEDRRFLLRIKSAVSQNRRLGLPAGDPA